MTIDKVILRVEHSSMSVDDKETADFIINIMRKYQKICKILDKSDNGEQCMYDTIQEIEEVRDGRDGNDD